MKKSLLVVNGHPDPSPARYNAALCDAYAFGARSVGWHCEIMAAGALDLPISIDHLDDAGLEALNKAASRLQAHDRLAVIFPLWLDGPPATLRQLLDFAWRGPSLQAASDVTPGRWSADIVVTMTMPSFLHRPRGLAALSGARLPERLILPGVAALSATFIGCVEQIDAAQRAAWLDAMTALGARVGIEQSARPFLRRAARLPQRLQLGF